VRDGGGLYGRVGGGRVRSGGGCSGVWEITTAAAGSGGGAAPGGEGGSGAAYKDRLGRCLSVPGDEGGSGAASKGVGGGGVVWRSRWRRGI
jgi:hypothetical protein